MEQKLRKKMSGLLFTIMITLVISSGFGSFNFCALALEPVTLTITAGPIIERSEAGKQITATISGGAFTSNNTSDWTVNELPPGVSIDTVSLISSTTAAITLKGNATVDYDNDKTNITVTCKATGYSDSAGGDITSFNSVTFTAIKNPKFTIGIPSIPSSLTEHSVTIEGSISFDPNDTVIERGIECYDNSTNVLIKKIVLSTDTFTHTVEGLAPNTVYYAKIYSITSEGKIYSVGAGFQTEKSNNANLSNLTLSNGTIAFDSATTTYAISVGGIVSSIKLTPTAVEPTATIMVSGAAVNSGVISQPVNLNVGDNTITIEVITDNGATSKTYTLNVNRGTPPPSPPSPPTSSSTHSNSNGVDVIVDGVKNSLATANTKQVNGATVTTVSVNSSALQAYLDGLKGQTHTVVIPVNTNSDTVVCQLNGAVISSMAERNIALEVRTQGLSYTVPLADIDLQSALQQLGSGAQLGNVGINIQISKSDEQKVRIVEDTAKKGNYTLVVKPVDFEVTVTYGDKTVRVSSFNGYVERTIAIPDGVDPSKITTGIVLNNDGTFSHVPTTIVTIDGKYYAKIKSLTNSTYAVIWNQTSFQDVKTHWAKEAVNDLGSRLIINGVSAETFSPNKDITRAEFASIIVKAVGLMRPDTGKEVFSDVKSDAWYFDAVSIAYERGIIKGYNGNFKPMEKITREEAMTMLSSAMKIAKLENSVSADIQNELLAKFSDGGKVSAWARDSVTACLNNKIVIGTNNNILPRQNITRAETAVIIERMLETAKLID